MPPRYQLEWATDAGRLLAVEPTPAEVESVVGLLTASYNDPHNHAMMGHDYKLTEADVLAYCAEMAEEGARRFHLFLDGQFLGDADFRNIEGPTAEFAILVGTRAVQGKGLGRRFAIMLHAFAFQTLGLKRIYVTVLPSNHASRKLFEKLGYTVDTSEKARSYIDEESDVAMSVDRAAFEKAFQPVLQEIRITER